MSDSSLFDRRSFLRAAAAKTSVTSSFLLTGCGLLEDLLETCPSDPSESGGIDWIPDVGHPVFYGFEDVDEADGAPNPARIFYPTYEGFTDGPPILKQCVARWPLVLFMHGQPPSSCPFLTDYHRRWAMVPAVLARSGYVTVVPNYSAELATEPDSPSVLLGQEMIEWVRSGWVLSEWVDGRREATAVAGHSYGALIAARIANATPTVSAYIGLSGPWSELSDRRQILTDLDIPSFFMWATGDPITGAFEDLDGLGVWPGIPGPKAAGVFPGEHFDYVRFSTCSTPTGDCALIEAVAAELATLFISRYMPSVLSTTTVAASLEPPDVTLTDDQQFFAGGHLSGLKQIGDEALCHVDLRWEDGAETGTRILGS